MDWENLKLFLDVLERIASSLEKRNGLPYRCPVCDGRREVPAGFYLSVGLSVAPEQCKSCNGLGILWGPAP